MRRTVDVSGYSFKAYVRELAELSGDAQMQAFVARYADDRAAGRADEALNR